MKNMKRNGYSPILDLPKGEPEYFLSPEGEETPNTRHQWTGGSFENRELAEEAGKQYASENDLVFVTTT